MLTSSKPNLLILLAAIFWLAACNAAPTSPTATAPPSQTPLPSETASPVPTSTPTETPTPSATPSPTETPTLTATPTPTPEPLIATILADTANIVSGPGINYAFLATYTTGLKLQVIGRSEDGLWLVVRLPGGTEGWIQQEKVTFEHEVAELAAFVAPPVPPPTETPIPGLSIFVNPSSGFPTTVFKVTISNFPPEEYATIEIIHQETGTTAFLGSMYTGNFGTNSINLRTFAQQTPPGTYVITITASDGRSVQASFIVKEREE